jgi:KEOPS complex subunit Pcc1
MIEKIIMDFRFEFENEEICQMVYDALNLESDYNPNERANASLEFQKKILILKINAKDSISARASVNSFLKWINLSLEVLPQEKE